MARVTAAARSASLACLLAAVGGCAVEAADQRPSLLLVVLDTVRADAVSAYGSVAGTTPFLDRLASEGLRYRHAFSNAPWTLPSHATLFTGLLPAQHGIGIRSWVAPPATSTLASRLAALGYAAAGFSENPLVGPATRLDGGFHSFAVLEGLTGAVGPASEWLAQRRDGPFFLFVNLIDAHSPYEVRESNPFVPADGAALAGRLTQDLMPGPLCHQHRTPTELAVLRGLYLGDVAAADRKLAVLAGAARQASGARPLVTVVTSDHGESFGEERLQGHLFGIGNQLLLVPLIVHGLPGVAPAVIDDPVQLASLPWAVLSWVGAGPRRPPYSLPTSARDRLAPAPIVSSYRDVAHLPSPEAPLFRYVAENTVQLRTGCASADAVFGDLDAVTEFPWKAVRRGDGSAALFDLRADPEESRDLAASKPGIASRLLRVIAPRGGR